MINKLSDLLKALVEAEVSALNKYGIKHRPTIGEMYEGLTKDIVDMSLFSGYNLAVATQSFIKGCDTEFDVILAEGSGETVPHTSSKIFAPKQVIAVFQVKKTLTSEELANSYSNLKAVDRVYEDSIDKGDISLARDAFKGICGKDITAYRAGLLTEQEEFIYHTLMVESILPLRIVIGYNGYKTEEGLRQAYLNFLGKNQSSAEKRFEGFSPLIFPNLIISERFSLVKLTGCPYSVKLGEVKKDWWEVMASSHFNPMHIFLEMLWTKLSYRFHNLPMEIFGEDLEIEPIVQFLRAKVHIEENLKGWDYEYSDYKEKDLSQQNEPQLWAPAKLDMAQFSVVSQLCNRDIKITEDKNLEAFVVENGYQSLESFIESLVTLRLAYLENDTLRLITKECKCIICPDGNSYAADDCDGRFSRWIEKSFFSSKMKNN